MSLEQRLHELSPDVNSNKMDPLWQELDGSSPGINSSHPSTTLTKAQQQHSLLAKAAALTGKLHVRYVAVIFAVKLYY